MPGVAEGTGVLGCGTWVGWEPRSDTDHSTCDSSSPESSSTVCLGCTCVGVFGLGGACSLCGFGAALAFFGVFWVGLGGAGGCSLLVAVHVLVHIVDLRTAI